MMSQKYRKLTYSDVNTIVEFVIGLCDIDTVFKNIKTTVKQRPELSAIPNPERSELLVSLSLEQDLADYQAI